MAAVSAETIGRRLSGIHERIVADVPALQRGRVWCRKCGDTEKVDAARCLRYGWPMCCGETMTIDAPPSTGESDAKP